MMHYNDTYDDVKPQINNTGEVVYEKHLIGDSEIYKFIDNKEYNISISSGGFDYNPQINSSGDVLWESNVHERHFIDVQPSELVTLWQYLRLTRITPPNYCP